MGNFGEYTIIETLGTGDMGTTYRAQHPQQPEPVALKILDKIDTSSQMKREAGVELIEFAMTLNNPRLQPITAILDNPEGDGRVGIVMPLAPLGSLGDWMRQGKLPPPKLGLKLIALLASALGYLLGQEVALGSLIPNFILLYGEDNLTLTDLPMAHLREMGFIPTEATTQHLLFMPPEREYHAPPELIGDVYSLAVLAYLLLAGNMPFTEPEPETRGVIPPHNLPPALVAVLRRAMNPHLRLRYQNLNELMTALKAAVQGKVDSQTERVFGVNAPPAPNLGE